MRDNGVGLSSRGDSQAVQHVQPRRSELGRAEGGLGIGLALAKGLVELHGGRIEARSAGPDQGSEFVIFLPKSLIVEAVRKSHRSARPGQGRDVATYLDRR